MALDATEARIGVTGNFFRAPIGTALPTDTGTALAAAYVELGYTETGPTMSVDTEKETFTPWQSQSPVREQVTAQTITSSFMLWQRNADTLKLAWGGGTVVASAVAGSTDRIFRPPALATVNEGVFVMEVRDGAIIDRYVIERASASLNGDVAFAKDAITSYEIELTFLQPVSGSAWQLISNDDNILIDA